MGTYGKEYLLSCTKCDYAIPRYDYVLKGKKLVYCPPKHAVCPCGTKMDIKEVLTNG